MKGTKIPFDIKYRPQIESGEYKVVTRDGKPVRIICWDRFAAESNDNIVALVTRTKYESAYYYYQDGHLWNIANCEGDSLLDLFIITPEPELTEFEIELHEIVSQVLSDKRIPDCREQFEKEAASALLIKAEKEICKGCTVGLDQYWKGHEDARKEAEESTYYHYPLYPAMCFHGGECTNPMRDCINCPMHSSGTTTNTTSGTCKKD